VRKADNLPPSCAVVMKSGSLNFLEPSGSLQACNGTGLPYFVMLNLVLWQHVSFLCVSCTLFRMSLVMLVHQMLCSVSVTLHSIHRMTHSKVQYMLPEDDSVIKTCRSVLNVVMKILDFLNNIYIYIYIYIYTRALQKFPHLFF